MYGASLLSLSAGRSTHVAQRLNFELVKCIDLNSNGDKGAHMKIDSQRFISGETKSTCNRAWVLILTQSTPVHISM